MANPEDKQMKMQWITVDGRTVPLVLPQIWDPDKEDWVVTSTENPLQVDAQLTGSNVEDGLLVRSAGINADFRGISVDDPDPLPAGGSRTYQIYSDPGEIWKVMRFGYNLRMTEGFTGSPRLALYQGENLSDTNQIASINSTSSRFLRGTVPGVTNPTHGGDISPGDDHSLIESIRGTTIMSHTLPLTIRVQNRSDMDLEVRGFDIFFYVEKVI